MEPLIESRSASRSEVSRPDGVDARPAPLPAGRTLRRGAARPANTIPVSALVQRLSLLADIELPCSVQLGNVGPDHGGSGRIHSCSCSGGRFSLTGEGFRLHLSESTIDSVRLTDGFGSRQADSCIEILSGNGNVMARIKSVPDRVGAAVWQDIMDTFDCT